MTILDDRPQVEEVEKPEEAKAEVQQIAPVTGTGLTDEFLTSLGVVMDDLTMFVTPEAARPTPRETWPMMGLFDEGSYCYCSPSRYNMITSRATGYTLDNVLAMTRAVHEQQRTYSAASSAAKKQGRKLSPALLTSCAGVVVLLITLCAILPFVL